MAEPLDGIDVLVPAVIASTRKPLGVLVGEVAAERVEHRSADEVLRARNHSVRKAYFGLVRADLSCSAVRLVNCPTLPAPIAGCKQAAWLLLGYC